MKAFIVSSMAIFLTNTQISESLLNILRILKLMPKGIIAKAKNKDKEAIVKWNFYAFLIVGSTLDVIITSNIILLNDLAARNNV